MFFDEMQNLHPILFIILIFAAVFIAIAIYARHVNNKRSYKDIQNSENKASPYTSSNYVSIDYRRLLDMLINK